MAPLILITGVTGYVGGRLLRAVEERGLRVRCLARRPEAVAVQQGSSTEVVRGDVLDRPSLDPAMQDVEVAYYLVHSMGSRGSFEDDDRTGAENFGAAARAAGVKRIIYLGGLGSEEEELSAHLRSRQEVGDILRQSGVPVIEFRASIVIGSGSLSFEMIRSLVDRLPVMITPRWVNVTAQPIAIDDLLAYLVAALDLPEGESRIFEIGGADQVSYADIMRVYARQRGKPLRMIPVPVLSPRLSSLWLALVTPLYARVGRKLIESIVHPTVVRDDLALRTFDVRPVGVEEAVRRAVTGEELHSAATRWADSVSSSGSPWPPLRRRADVRFVDSRVANVAVPAAVAFEPIERIGGGTGWYAFNWLWRARGFLDLMAGGVGVRRGRPSPISLRTGDAVDFWRVEAFEPGRRLRLVAEMKLPGTAWLEFEVTGTGLSSTIRQTATFDAEGLDGKAYWYALYPVHRLVFDGMLRGIARAAVRTQQSAGNSSRPS
ncbi:MAG TPA: SDR family oxidoreductase [Gemmatimonadaceae bacterium]